MSSDDALDAGLLAFQEESFDLLEAAEATLLKLEDDPEDGDLIGELFRSVHTIKGSAGIFGFNDVVSFTHVAESVLGLAREEKLNLDMNLISLLLDSSDHIKVLVEAALADEECSESAKQQGDKLLDSLNQYLGESPVPAAEQDAGDTGSAAATSSDSGQASANTHWHISLRFPEDTLMSGMEPVALLSYLKKLGTVEDVKIVDVAMPSYDQLDPERYFLGLEIRLQSDASQAEIEEAFEFFSDGCTISVLPPHSPLQSYKELLNELPEKDYFLGELFCKMGALTEDELDYVLQKQNELRAQNAAAPKEGFETPKLGTLVVEEGLMSQSTVQMALDKQEQSKKAHTQKNQTIRINPDKLGYLIDLVGELVISSAHINVRVKQQLNEEIVESAENMAGLVDEIRSVSLGLRMVQIGDTFDRYRRVVRDLSKEFHKDIDLIIEGGETELDKTVVEKISDPLMHMVRNAIDHGIEVPETRLENGKPRKAQLRLSAYHESGNVSIEVSDDGGGLDSEKIREKAIRNELIKPDSKLSTREIYRLIFEPGFSTAEKISSVSGRGVGMDVVKRNVEELRGSVDVESELGKGTTFTIRLPLTLAIIDGFQVDVNGCSYIIPLGVIDECIELNEQLSNNDGDYINLRGDVLPFVRLNDIFGNIGPNSLDLSNDDETEGRRENIVVVQFSGKKFGLVVDELLGEQQAVIKPMGKIFQNLSCISGATILGGGDVALIIDVPRVLSMAKTMKRVEVVSSR